jgi:hypothetical protein
LVFRGYFAGVANINLYIIGKGGKSYLQNMVSVTLVAVNNGIGAGFVNG